MGASFANCCGADNDAEREAELKGHNTDSKADGDIYSDATKYNKTWNKNARIIIVGAGAAGINMNTILKDNGYTNITILEKTDRVGGKSHTLWDEFKTPHDMGTCYMHPEYDVVREIIQKYDPENKEMTIDSNVFDTDEKTGGVSLTDFILDKIEEMVIMNKLLRKLVPDFLSGGIKLLKSVKNYKKGYLETFGTTKHLTNGYGFPPKPQDMSVLNMTYLEWLKKHDCEGLIPTLIYTTTTQAYGELDKIPAFYGLFWNRPDLLNHLVDLAEQAKAKRRGEIFHPMLYNGFESIWQKVAAKENLNIKFNVNITEINRNIGDDNKPIQITIDNNETMECDVLFMAVDQRISLKLFKNPTQQETEVFSNLTPFTMVTTLYKNKFDDKEKKPIKFEAKLWPSHLLLADGQLYAARHSMRILREQQWRDKYKKNNSTDPEYSIAFQFRTAPTEATDEKKEESKNVLIKNLEDKGYENVEVVEQRYWDNYFPKWSQEEVNKGYPWLVRDEMQGKIKNTYYIGSSICFESLLNVIAYNKELALQLGLN